MKFTFIAKQRWSHNFGPVVKLDELTNDEQYDTQALFG